MSNGAAENEAKTWIRSKPNTQSLQDYVTERKIGEGGMAAVFLASEPKMHRKVALKVMLPHLASNPDFVSRFLQEVQATIGLQHPHIVQLLGYGQDAGQYFMACELMDGGTVRDLLRTIGRFPLPLALEVAAQMFEALSYAHAQGIVHRDLKPANLLLARQGSLKVGDFGIAKNLGTAGLTQTGMLLGTPAYMSPEQAMGQRVDARSDLYSSGVVLYELLTGSNPRESDNPTTALAKVLNGKLSPVYEVEPSIPAYVQEVLDGLLARDREARFASAEEVLSQLKGEIAESRRQYPTLLADCLANPGDMKQRLTRDLATRCYQRAQEQIKTGLGGKESAALWAYHAVSLEPTNQYIQRFFKEICGTHSLRFEPSVNPKVLELEKLLEKEPDTPGVLQQLAHLYRMEGNIHRAVVYLKRYLQLRPKDGYAASQLLQMTGENPASRTGIGPRTSELGAGIRTGGFKAMAKQASSSPTGAYASESTASPAAEVAISNSVVSQLWNGWMKTLLVVGCIGAAVAFVAKRVNRMIDSATHEATSASDALAKNRETAENAHLTEQSQRTLAQSSEANARDASRMLETARAAFNKEKFVEAIEGFEALIQRYPKRVEAITANFLRAKSLLATGQQAKAIVALSEYLDQHAGTPEYWEALLRRGQAYHSQLQDALALSDLDQLLQKQPNSPWAAEALVERGEIRAGRGNRDDAAADFGAALARTGPSDPLNTRATADLKGLGSK